MQRKGNTHTLLVGLQIGTAVMENSMVVFKKLKMDIPFDSAIALLGIYPKKTKTIIHKDVCTPIFMAAQFTIAKIWKQPKHPSTDDWIKKLWFIYTMEYYSAIKKMKSYHLQRHGWT